MKRYGDYTTLDAVRTSYLGSAATGQDTMLADLIHSTSREMEDIAGRKFYPRIETRYFDTPSFYGVEQLWLDDDLLSLTTLMNGDGIEIPAAAYVLRPRNESPKHSIELLMSSAYRWQITAAGDPQDAISVAGVWGYHSFYDGAWQDTLATVQNDPLSSGGTSLTGLTTGKLHAGDMLLIESEYIYVVSVTVSTTDTATIVRGIHGSTAAAHIKTTPIYRWTHEEIEMLARMAVAAYFRLRQNPIGDTVNIGGQTFSTPKDITAWMTKRMTDLDLIWVRLS